MRRLAALEARKLQAPGHEVRLLPPQYVRPYVKRGNNDRHDAAAICEAAGRPAMRFVAIKSEDRPARAMVLKVRATLVAHRTDLANTLHGHAAESGMVAPKGRSHLPALLAAAAAEPSIPPPARKPRKVAAVALANKMARIVWAMMTTGEAYRAPGPVGAAAATPAIS